MTRISSDHVQKRGDWFIRHLSASERELFGFSFCCCGCGSECYVPIAQNAENDETKWDWDGNLETPTLKPSLLNRCCGWHGHMRVGQWVAEPGSTIPDGAN